ncbi:Ig-like domain-containing protein [Pseudomonas sp. NFACC45]|uniref:Ig-like domain-containing protein n=1 Tax=Pseudomonas sp. NFACC45 TaxID=1566201 RepID=UPI0008E552B4|nr:Ig-like domain-containing protein [Pseudomonas sp. NFACC45]SFH47235.1 Ig-like domain (group 2) [Pseudomonas sp. NFACC45]
MSNTPNLPPPSVDEAPDGVLELADIPPDGARVRIKRYTADTHWQKVFVFVGSDYENQLPVGANIRDVVFYVAAEHFTPDSDGIVLIRYKVLTLDDETLPSDELPLEISAGFAGPAALDLRQNHYVAVADKAPLVVPGYARMTRVATWGSPPYGYASSDENVASVNALTGEVTARGNGQCTITATDSLNQPRAYPLTVSGIRQLYYLSSSADWQGMIRVCDAASLDPVTLLDIKRLWTLYSPGSGGVANYLGWLNYPFWTGDTLGAGTAWAYDLNGEQVNENATSLSTDTYLPVLGASRDTP